MAEDIESPRFVVYQNSTIFVKADIFYPLFTIYFYFLRYILKFFYTIFVITIEWYRSFATYTHLRIFVMVHSWSSISACCLMKNYCDYSCVSNILIFFFCFLSYLSTKCTTTSKKIEGYFIKYQKIFKRIVFCSSMYCSTLAGNIHTQ